MSPPTRWRFEPPADPGPSGPACTDAELFERLTFLVFQTIIGTPPVARRWPAIRAAFAGFDPDRVAVLDPEAVLAAPGAIANRKKVLATLANARAFQRIRAEHGSFRAYADGFTGDAEALAADLDDRLAYVGRPSIRAFLAWTGLPAPGPGGADPDRVRPRAPRQG